MAYISGHFALKKVEVLLPDKQKYKLVVNLFDHRIQALNQLYIIDFIFMYLQFTESSLKDD